MVGEYVGVAWTLIEHEKKIEDGNQLAVVASYERKTTDFLGNPYKPFISFFWVRHDGEEYYLDEDCSVDGGFYADEAEIISGELKKAARYCREVTKDG